MVVGVLYGLSKLEKHEIIAKVASLTREHRHIYSHEDDRENAPIQVSNNLLRWDQRAHARIETVRAPSEKSSEPPGIARAPLYSSLCNNSLDL